MSLWGAFKKQTGDKSASLAKDGPKWKKRGDLEADRVKRYLEEQEKEKEAQAAKRVKRLEGLLEVKIKAPVVEDKVGPNGTPTKNEDAEGHAEGKYEADGMSVKEVATRLRAIGEPVTLFGETDKERWLRLRHLQLTGNYDMLVEQGHNAFGESLKKNADELFRRAAEDTQEDEETRIAREAEAVAKLAKELQEIEGILAAEDITMGDKRDEYVSATFRRCLKAWELTLASRDRADKETPQGLQDTGYFTQTSAFTQPLFAALKQRTLPGDILIPLAEICHCIHAREYRTASEWYMKLSIGNAAWPMGVTSVGIHERAATNNIYCGKVAHILNNDTQRKYIQGAKRLMTKAQQLWPTDPSKCV